MSLRLNYRRYLKKHPVLGLLILLEVLLRFFPSTREFIYCEKQGEVGWFRTEDAELFYRKIDFTHAGLILNKELFFKKAHPLVLTLGGSIAYGSIGNEFMPGGELTGGVHGYNKHILQYLQKTCNFSQAKVWDLTSGGYTSYQSRIILDRALKIVRPDLILISNGTNDAQLTYTSHRIRAEENRKWNRRLLHYCYKSRIVCLYAKILKYAKERLLHKESPQNEKSMVEQVPLGDYRDNLERIASQALKSNIPILFITQYAPQKALRTKLEKYFAVMKDVAQSYPNVTYVDVRPQFEARIREIAIDTWEDEKEKLKGDCFLYVNELFSDCIHPNKDGYSLMFQAIIEAYPQLCKEKSKEK